MKIIWLVIKVMVINDLLTVIGLLFCLSIQVKMIV